MQDVRTEWDYLIVTAGNEQQGEAYERQLALRRELGLLAGVGEVLVVPDPAGRRVGSGGSTVWCLMEILRRQLEADSLGDADAWQECLEGLRVLILHAGGDSRRLPAYGPCGKLFIPMPGDSDSVLGMTLFDRQLSTYLRLPAAGKGQIVITSGDVLLGFDPQSVEFAPQGVTGLACLATPQKAAGHGVYCPGTDGRVRLYLQKPSPQQQDQADAVDRYGRSLLDIGVIGFDGATARRLLEMCGTRVAEDRLEWSGPVGEAVVRSGMDFYREVCCALGDEATPEHLAASVLASGGAWGEELLGQVHAALAGTEFHVRALDQCTFLHFGTTEQILSSGESLLAMDRGAMQAMGPLEINNRISEAGGIAGSRAWVEGCRLSAPLRLGGRNVVVGADVVEPLDLPAGACLDIIPGHRDNRQAVHFIRCYGVEDDFKTPAGAGGTFCNLPVLDWLRAMGAKAEEVWGEDVPEQERTVWEARLFPGEAEASDFGKWIWMFEPAAATRAQKRVWRQGRRYSLAEIALATDQDAFHRRRLSLRAQSLRTGMRGLFRYDSGFSAAELAFLLEMSEDRAGWVADLLSEAHWHGGDGSGGQNPFATSRILHTLGSALVTLVGEEVESPLSQVVGEVELDKPVQAWLHSQAMLPAKAATALQWACRLQAAAFESMSRRILASSPRTGDKPRSALRSDEIVWGRCPARLDLGGGWSDTPPYTLEFGGRVINASVDLNGQPPIQCYARVIPEMVIRITSIDLGKRVELRTMDDLMNFRSATDEFGLAKAALAMSIFGDHAGGWTEGTKLQPRLESFGGGMELTTLAAIPKGSGLGTSSLVAAAILAVLHRVLGRTLTHRELFHGVLRIEQALTTGGGWQDQVGGAVDGVKLVHTTPGLVPDVRVHYVPDDVLAPYPAGVCLLYYTGITRLAKDILQSVVGSYLDRDRQALATLRSIHDLPDQIAVAMGRKDATAFGHLVARAWDLNRQLDPDSTNDQVEELMGRIAPHVHGAKLLGAGGGGFAMMVCRSIDDAARVREMLQAEPPNERARFFDFGISRRGLVVTVC